MVEITDLVVSFPRFQLGPISAELAAGRRVAVVGPNGAGKSTTLNVIAGLHSTFAGHVSFGGRDLRAASPLIRADIGFVPEEMTGFPWMTVQEHLDFLSEFYPHWDVGYADQLVDRLGLDRGERLGALSKGSRVKLSIVGAESHRPPLLLLDEPTSGLDPVVRHTLITTLQDCVPVGGDRLLIFSTHILEDVDQVADHVLALRGGRLVAHASIEELRRNASGSSLSGTLLRLLAE